MTSPTYYEQPIIILDTTESTSLTSGSLVLYGGLTIHSTTNSVNSSSGSLILGGGVGVLKNVNIDGITRIWNTTDNTSFNDGALIVDGGVGVAKDITIGGDATINGNLYVAGTTTSVNSTTVNISDNTLLLNSGPSGSRDSGLLIQRYQTDVNDGSGDVVDADEPIAYTGALDVGGTTTLTLPTGASGVDDFYKFWWIKITSGDAINNVRQITAYNGTTKVITLSSALSTAASTDNFNLYNRNYVVQYFDESANMMVFGYTADATDISTTISNNSLADIYSKSLFATNATVGNFVATNFSAGTIGISSADLTDLVATNSTIDNIITTSVTSSSIFVNGVITAGGLAVTGSSLFNTIYVTGGSNLESFLNVTGASILNLGITTGSIYVTGGTNLASTLVVTGASTFVDAVNATSTLNVTGASNLSTLNVTGASIFNLGVTTGSILVTGGAYLASTLVVTGASTFIDVINANSTLNVTGASILNLGITTGSIYVTGSSLLNNVDIQGTLTVTGASLLKSNLTVTGGSIVFNTVDVSPSMGDIVKELTATAGNSISSVTDVLGFAFGSGVRAFDSIVSVSILTTGDVANKYAFYNLKGVHKNGTWTLTSSFVGDITGITFSITSSGQIQYTTTNTTDFVSNTIKYRALTTSV
jgi:hypothetical protein